MIKTPSCAVKRLKCAEPSRVICRSALLRSTRNPQSCRVVNISCLRSDRIDVRKGEGHRGVGSLLLGCLCFLSVVAVAPSENASAYEQTNIVGNGSENQETASPLIQRLLERTEAKREERRSERLRDYYRRNYQDYFGFQSRDMKSLSPETQEEIRRWLQENGESKNASKASN